MELHIRFGTPDDASKVQSLDHHVKREYIDFKLHRDEIILAEYDGNVVGYLRLDYIWTRIPYIGLLEEYLRQQGCMKLYSSSQVNKEEPQQGHRTKGFVETGIINGINEGEIGEVFFVKGL